MVSFGIKYFDNLFSAYQLIALGLFLISVIFLIVINKWGKISDIYSSKAN